MKNDESLSQLQERLAAQDRQLADGTSRMDRTQTAAIDPAVLESVDVLCRQGATPARSNNFTGLRC